MYLQFDRLERDSPHRLGSPLVLITAPGLHWLKLTVQSPEASIAARGAHSIIRRTG